MAWYESVLLVLLNERPYFTSFVIFHGGRCKIEHRVCTNVSGNTETDAGLWLRVYANLESWKEEMVLSWCLFHLQLQYSTVGLMLSCWQSATRRKCCVCGSTTVGHWCLPMNQTLKAARRPRCQFRCSLFLTLIQKLQKEAGKTSIFFFFFKKERLKHDSMLRGMKSPLSLLFTPIISLQSVPNGASGQPAADPCVKVIKTIIIIIKIAV